MRDARSSTEGCRETLGRLLEGLTARHASTNRACFAYAPNTKVKRTIAARVIRGAVPNEEGLSYGLRQDQSQVTVTPTTVQDGRLPPSGDAAAFSGLQSIKQVCEPEGENPASSKPHAGTSPTTTVHGTSHDEPAASAGDRAWHPVPTSTVPASVITGVVEQATASNIIVITTTSALIELTLSTDAMYRVSLPPSTKRVCGFAIGHLR